MQEHRTQSGDSRVLEDTTGLYQEELQFIPPPPPPEPPVIENPQNA